MYPQLPLLTFIVPELSGEACATRAYTPGPAAASRLRLREGCSTIACGCGWLLPLPLYALPAALCGTVQYLQV